MTPIDATAATPEGTALLKAVSDLSDRRPVVASRAIFNERGVKLIEHGAALDGSLYDRLIQHRLSAPLDECVAIEPCVDGESVRAAAQDAMQASPFFEQMGPTAAIRNRILEAVSAVPLPRPIAFQLTLVREERPGLFEHSVWMALLCAHLVREGGAPGHDVTMAAAAGLLHDLGMLHIEPDLLAPGNTLIGDQRKPLYAHSLTSSILLGRFHEYPRDVARAVLEHHERMDGSGYPRALAGEQISPLGRVLSLAEVVTAMFGLDRPYPAQRVSLLLRMSPRRYDPLLVPSIHRMLRALPVAADLPAVPAAESIERLRALSGLLTDGQSRVAACATLSPGPGSGSGSGPAILQSIAAQIETLQRMLFDAGIQLEQLSMLADTDAQDPAVAIELWTLGEELQWQLRTTARQIRRRWRAGEGAHALPASVLEWLDLVDR
ncbi:MAG: HD domain-containing protein [Burkholderiaceae bacterium]|nr:HD domain-containing protein [Burkholderiaceae bacterium]